MWEKVLSNPILGDKFLLMFSGHYIYMWLVEPTLGNADSRHQDS
jgi:hypothetical protein